MLRSPSGGTVVWVSALVRASPSKCASRLMFRNMPAILELTLRSASQHKCHMPGPSQFSDRDRMPRGEYPLLDHSTQVPTLAIRLQRSSGQRETNMGHHTIPSALFRLWIYQVETMYGTARRMREIASAIVDCPIPFHGNRKERTRDPFVITGRLP